MIDLTNETFLPNRYGGSEKKKTLLYKGRLYMVKFPDPIRQKGNDLSYMNNAFSEDIGCKIAESIGFSVQDTFLALYREDNGKEKIVVACEDFCQDGAVLSEFSKMILSDTDNDRRIAKRVIPIEIVMDVIDATPVISDKEAAKDRFWDLFVFDTLIGNQDRHLDNWGFLLKNNQLEFAPIYDCGSALSPLLSDDAMDKISSNISAFKDHEYNLSSPYSYEGKRVFYPKIFEAPPEPLKRAIQRIVPQINRSQILKIVENTERMSQVRKFYISQALSYRYNNILEKSLQRLNKKEKAYSR